uniref:Uncharacterized protein n=1 Tax=Solanum tuberosum TaxID=4113 RepID=M1C933_SOLTU
MASVLCRLGITVGYGTNHEVMVLGLFKNIVKCVLDPPKVGVIVSNDGILLHNYIQEF